MEKDQADAEGEDEEPLVSRNLSGPPGIDSHTVYTPGYEVILFTIVFKCVYSYIVYVESAL